MQSGRIGPLTIGLTDIHRWREADEAHLPIGQTQRVPFLPEQRPLDAILRRETLEERLTAFILPDRFSPALGEHGAIPRAREALHRRFRSLADRSTDPRLAGALQDAADLLAHETELDDEVQMALAALLRA